MFIKFGWWILPTVFTIFCFTLAWLKRLPVPQSRGWLNGIYESAMNFGIFTLALVASLSCWIVYFVIIVVGSGGLS